MYLYIYVYFKFLGSSSFIDISSRAWLFFLFIKHTFIHKKINKHKVQLIITINYNNNDNSYNKVTNYKNNYERNQYTHAHIYNPSPITNHNPHPNPYSNPIP